MLLDFFLGSNQRYYNVIGIGVPLARGAAGPIRLNCAFILITVLRNFLSWYCVSIFRAILKCWRSLEWRILRVRGTWVGTYLPIDKNIVFHKGIAWTIAAFATVHTYITFCKNSKCSLHFKVNMFCCVVEQSGTLLQLLSTIDC
jgi:hypothetical protein